MPHSFRNPPLRPLSAAFFLFFAVSFAQASNLRVAWNASADSNVAGYNIAYGTSSGRYNKTLNAGNSTSATVPSLTPSTTYYFVVKAYNSFGLESLPSNEVAVTTPINLPPSVALTSPQTGASFNGSTPISLTANASDSDGTVVKVEFYQGTSKIGQATNTPYGATWNNAPTGNYTLTALAYDDNGAAVRSAAAQVTVGSAPAASPPPAALIKIQPVAMSPLIRAGAVANFRLLAAEAPSQSMVVNYALTGTAAPGVDYTMPSVAGQITIPAGARGAMMPLQTKHSGVGGGKTLTLSILPGNGYGTGRRSSATVRILGR